MLPYALYFLNTISVAFLGCVYVCISCTVSKVHICAVVRGVRLYFSSAPLLTSTSQLFHVMVEHASGEVQLLGFGQEAENLC